MPITLNGDTGIQTPMYNGTITANAVTPSVNMKNRLINSAMVIDQRNAGASVTNVASAATYTLDRWFYFASQASKFTVQQDAGAITPPAGFNDYLGITSLSAYTVGSSEIFLLAQHIEGFNVADLNWGTANAKTVTLSFWVRSSLTGTFGGSLRNSDSNRSYPFTYTISAANTWEQKSVTVAGDTSGTWLTTNGTGIRLTFGLGMGSSFSGTAGSWSSNNYISATGATSVVGTNGATFYITGVQLEVGSTATSFDYRPIGTELALCQRYYVRYSSSGAQNQAFLIGVVGGSTSAGICSTNFGNPMRASPTASYSGPSTLRIYDGSVVPAITSIGGSSSSTTGTADFIASGGGLTTGRAALIIPNGSPCYVDFSAEL